MALSGDYDDLLDEAALMIAMAFRKMIENNLSDKEIMCYAYDIASAVRGFASDLVNNAYTV